MRPKSLFCNFIVTTTFLFFFNFNSFAQIIRDTLINEDFTGSVIPTNWTQDDHAMTGEIWEFNDPGNRNIGGNFDADFAILDSDNYDDGGSQNVSLVTPVLDLSNYSASTKLYVKFDYQYNDDDGDSDAILEIYNGTTWIQVKSYTHNYSNSSSMSSEYLEISDSLIGKSNAQIRMKFIGEWQYWWAVDNFVVYATYADQDGDGIADLDDADADNDGIPNAIEVSCNDFDLVFEDHWTVNQDPVLDAPSPSLDFGQTTVTLERRDPQGIIEYGVAANPADDSTGIATQNGVLSYKILQKSNLVDSSEHIFKFSKPVSNLVFGILDVDRFSNFTDHVVIKGYVRDTIYTIQPRDVKEGDFAYFNEGENSFTGHTTTQSSDANSQVHFPVLIDSVVVIYSNKDVTPSAHQAIIFNASFDFCDVADTDKDGIPDYLDLDSDNDGIPDLIEAGGVDTDGDGLVDSFSDIDKDGLAAAFDNDDNDKSNTTSNLMIGDTIAQNSDTDSYPDYLDLDADNDGISDIVEAGGIDTNGDGFVDDLDAKGQLSLDADNDGFTDRYDPDNDGTPGVDSGSDDEPLIETNGSGTHLNGTTGASKDTDSDGYPDYLDLDADNDAIPDLVEAGGIDTNGDGRVDIVTDDDQDGYADIYDTDDDGTSGVEDATDALLQTGGTDTDMDGKADSATTFNNGLGDNKDTDGDGWIDGLDLDADDDGIPDHVEAGATDPEDDGMVDTAAFPWDADEDGLADTYDENPNDGPAGVTGITNGISLVETTADSNNDGIVNANEAMAAGGGGNNNTNADQDKYPNHLDLDADNDGITDVVENAGGSVSADHSSGTLDGIVGDNAQVTDSDNNGWHDPSDSNTTDSDGDNLPDFLDKDADNDGIVDYLEGVCSTCPTFVTPSGNDANKNGVLDMYENLTSANGNGGTNIGTTPNEDDDDGNLPPDYLDTDTDEDGEFDWTEGYDANDNGVASDDIITMAATYESSNSNPGHYPTTDDDSDGIPNWLDNMPNTSGYDKNARPPFLDSTNPAWIDTDYDGLVAIFDTDEKGVLAPTPDNNGGNDNDWRDMTALVSLPVELTSFAVENSDCSTLIKWSTASEENFSHFEIERSSNGNSFQRIASVESKGGNQPNAYQYFDQDTRQNVQYYYQLKMIDLDQSVEYSNVVSLVSKCKGVDFSVNIYPNPVAKDMGKLTLELKANTQNRTYRIMDAVGKIWGEGTVDPFQQIVKIDVEHLPTGSYYILMEDHAGWLTERFVKLNQ